MLKDLTGKLTLVFVRNHDSKLSILQAIPHAVWSDRDLIILTSIYDKQAWLHRIVKNFSDNYETICASHPCAALYYEVNA